MCTVSIIPLPAGYRVVHSRDEQRSRTPGTPPRKHLVESADGLGVEAHWPVDPDAGGTWIACSGLGITHGILNVNIGAQYKATKSRGTLIPDRIHLDTGQAVMDSLASTDLCVYTTFRYLAVADEGVWDARWDGEHLAVEHHRPISPICFASSGLGDDLVQCRLPLFDEIVKKNPTAESQDRFHSHQWPDRPEYSVMMSRADARTVSIVTVEFHGARSPMMSHRTIDLGDPVCDPIGAAMLQ